MRKIIEWIFGKKGATHVGREAQERFIALEYVDLWNQKHPEGPVVLYDENLHAVRDEEWNLYPFLSAWEEYQTKKNVK